MTLLTARLRALADFGLASQQARIGRGLKQAELAEQIDVSQSAISEIERGRATIYLRRMLEIARVQVSSRPHAGRKTAL